jgi:hypothetical protein
MVISKKNGVCWYVSRRQCSHDWKGPIIGRDVRGFINGGSAYGLTRYLFLWWMICCSVEICDAGELSNAMVKRFRDRA